MAQEVHANQTINSGADGRQRSAMSREEALAASLPPQVKEQPDPMLQMSVGRIGARAVTLVAVIAAVILAVVFYGLNSPPPANKNAGTPVSAATSPAGGNQGAPATPAPQGNAKSHS